MRSRWNPGKATGCLRAPRLGSITRLLNAMGLNWEDYLQIDAKLIRQAEFDLPCRDATRAREDLGGDIEVTPEDLIKKMVEADLEALRRAENGDAPSASVRVGAL
jgi:hypothetical protein